MASQDEMALAAGLPQADASTLVDRVLLEAQVQDMYRQGVDRLANVLQEGMDAGVLRPMEARRLAFFLQEMMSTVLGQRLQGKAKTSVEEDAEQLLDFFLHGALRREALSR